MYWKASRYIILSEFAQSGTHIDSPKVIDCACGKGRGFPYIIKSLRPSTIVGVDNDKDQLTGATNTYLNRRWFHRIQLIRKDILKLRSKEKFDMFFCCETLEHLEKKSNKKVVKAILNAVKPGGKILISFPINERSIENPEHKQLLTEEEIFDHFGKRCILLGKAYHMTEPTNKKKRDDCSFMVGFEKRKGVGLI